MTTIQKIIYYSVYWLVYVVVSASILILSWNYLVKDFFCWQSMEIKHALGIMLIRAIFFEDKKEDDTLEKKEQNFFVN